jgi:SAM-dependent methyltransferase
MSVMSRFKSLIGTAEPAPKPEPEPYMRPGGAEHRALLAEINAEIPPGVDWTAGALNYVQAEIEKHGREAYQHYLLTKPFAPVGPGEEGRAARIENLAYFNNFANAFGLLDLPGHSRVLDVACGSGWVSQFFARMGYAVHGFDICPDMVELTRRRLREDTQLASLHDTLDERVFVLDVERQPLPASLHGTVGAIVLESCLHHFIDPVTALSHLVEGMASDGLMLIVEGEARSGPLNPAYLAVMQEFQTLERPYTRDQLKRMLGLVGLPHHCFLGRLNGWFTPDDPRLPHLSEHVATEAAALNFTLCARTAEALRRVVPHHSPPV